MHREVLSHSFLTFCAVLLLVLLSHARVTFSPASYGPTTRTRSVSSNPILFFILNPLCVSSGLTRFLPHAKTQRLPALLLPHPSLPPSSSFLAAIVPHCLEHHRFLFARDHTSTTLHRDFNSTFLILSFCNPQSLESPLFCHTF